MHIEIASSLVESGNSVENLRELGKRAGKAAEIQQLAALRPGKKLCLLYTWFGFRWLKLCPKPRSVLERAAAKLASQRVLEAYPNPP